MSDEEKKKPEPLRRPLLAVMERLLDGRGVDLGENRDERQSRKRRQR